MSDDEDDGRERGYYWIRLGGLEAEVAMWEPEGGGWFLPGMEEPLDGTDCDLITVLSGPLVPPAQH